MLSNFKKISKFYLNDLLKSKIVVIATILFLVLPIPIVIGFYYFDPTMYYVSFWIAICFLGIILLFSFLIVNKLFSENKFNFSDVNLISKNYSRKMILGTKLLISFSLLIILDIEMIILSAIILYSYKVDVAMVNAICVSNLIGLMINFFAIVPILVLISIFSKQIWFSICSFFIIFGLIFSSFAGNYMLTNSSQNNNLSAKANMSTKNTYVKIIKVNNNGQQVGEQIAVATNYANNTSVNTNDDYQNNLNNVAYANNFIPGQLFYSPQSGIYNALISDSSLNYLNQYEKYKGSLVRFVGYNKQNANTFIENNGQYIYIPLSVFQKSPFLLSSEEIKLTLKNAIDSIINNFNNEDIINLSNPTDITNALNVLQGNVNWSNLVTTNPKLINTISDLIGIDTNPILYYLWNYQSIFKIDLANISQYISTNYNSALWDFLNFLWTNNNVFVNVFIENVNNMGQKLINLYPNDLSIKYDAPALNKDINFIKNTLINFQNSSTPLILLNNGSYAPLDATVFASTFNLKPNENQSLKLLWDNMMKSNLTYTQLGAIYQDLLKLNSNLMPYFISSNYFSPDQYNYIFNIKSEPFIDKAYIPIIFELIIGLVVLLILFPIYKRASYNI